MYCPNCAAVLSGMDSRWCPACGAPAPAGPGSSKPSTVAVTSQPLARQVGAAIGRHRERSFVLLFVFLFLLAGAVVFLAFHSGGSNPVPLVRVQLQPGESSDAAIARAALLKTAACQEHGVTHIELQLVGVDGNATSISEPCHG